MAKFRGKKQKAKKGKEDTELQEVITQTIKLWQKHHLSYQQSKYVVEEARKELALRPEKRKVNIVNRLSKEESRQLIEVAYQEKGQCAHPNADTNGLE